METLETCSKKEVERNTMWKFHQKLKRMFSTLNAWSKKEFGDIFQKVKLYEEQVHKAEEKYILDPIDSKRTNLYELNAKKTQV